MKGTFTLWGVQDRKTREILSAHTSRMFARDEASSYHYRDRVSVVKLKCRIVPRKSKRVPINPELKTK